MQEKTEQFEIKHFWGVLLKRKYVAISVALAVISIFTWGSLLMPKTYEAESIVAIEGASIIDPLIEGVGVSGNINERLSNLRDNITSRNILERVATKLDLISDAKKSENFEHFIQEIRKKLTIDVKVKNTRDKSPDLFIFSLTGSDPRRVRDIVNTIVSEYIEENVDYKRSDAYGAYDFIAGQLVEYKNKLDESDEAIRKFRERNPRMTPQSETTLLGRLENFETARIESEIKLKELLRKRDNLQKQLSGEKELTVSFVSKDGSPQARLNFLNNQLMMLSSKYTENYPEVIKVKHEIEEVKKQIDMAKESRVEATGSEIATLNPVYQQLKEDFSAVEAEIESLKARLSELTRQQHAAQGILGNRPKEQEEWSKLQRDRTVYQRIYDDLLQKLENARVSKELELSNKTANLRIIDPAILPMLPIKPDRIKLILLGFVLSIVAGAGAVLVLENLDHSFKSEEAIQSTLKLPVLATLPKIVTEADEVSEKKLQHKVFIASGVYLLLIGMVFVHEVLARYMGVQIINF